jgi:hypothetical protein
MTENVKRLLNDIDLLTEFTKYKSIMLNAQDNEFVWGYLESINNKYQRNQLTPSDITMFEDLWNVIMKEYGQTFISWSRNKKLKGFL